MGDRSDHVMSNAGVRMPRFIYGTAWKEGLTSSLVAQAIAQGFRGIDTACQPKHYHEPGVGEGVAQALRPGLSREDLYLQTKFTTIDGQDPRQVPYDPAAPLAEQVRQSFAVSLKNLRVNVLDGLILHSPLPDEAGMLEVWRAMEELVDGKGVRQIGISNCYDVDDLTWLYQQARVKPAVVQNRFYAQTGYDREVRAFCREKGILYQGFWALKANPGVLAHHAVQSLTVRYQRTPQQIFFRFLTQNGIIPLTGTTSEEHMREDLAIFTFELTNSECATLGTLLWGSGDG